MLAQLLAPPPRIVDLAPEHAAIVAATRAWVMAQRVEHSCPAKAAADRLGCVEGARALRLLLATMGAAWPDPVAIAPPCCPALTHDEATLIAMTVAACSHGRPVFDALLCEMLTQDARDRLFPAARALGQAMLA